MFPKVCGNTKAAIVLLQRGISENIEKKWKLYFYLGMIYHEQYGDNATAALYSAIAAQLPGAPSVKLANLAASLYKKGGNETQDARFLSLLFASSENPEVRRILFGK